MRWLGPMVCLAACGNLAACGDEAAGDRVTVRDSAGISIVENRAGDARAATVADTPVFSIGGPDAAGAAQFANVRGVIVDDDGAIWVADGTSAELRKFSAAGAHLLTVGGQGDGPGEFRRIRLLGESANGDVALWDDALHRLTLVHPDGTLASVQNFPAAGGTIPRAFGIFPDGDLLLRESPELSAAALTPGVVFTDSTMLFAASPAGDRMSPVATAGGPLWQWTGRLQVPIAFTINAWFATKGDTVFTASGPEFEVRAWVGGGVEAIHRAGRASRPVERAHAGAYRSYLEDVLPDSQRLNAYLATIDHPRMPAFIPAYQQLVAADDVVWALIYEPDPRSRSVWDLYDDHGRLLGQAETPAGLAVHAITDDAVVGVFRDDLGVEYLQKHRLERAPR